MGTQSQSRDHGTPRFDPFPSQNGQDRAPGKETMGLPNCPSHVMGSERDVDHRAREKL